MSVAFSRRGLFSALVAAPVLLAVLDTEPGKKQFAIGVPICCGLQMVPRVTAMIFDCSNCGSSMLVHGLINAANSRES